MSHVHFQYNMTRYQRTYKKIFKFFIKSRQSKIYNIEVFCLAYFRYIFYMGFKTCLPLSKSIFFKYILYCFGFLLINYIPFRYVCKEAFFIDKLTMLV